MAKSAANAKAKSATGGSAKVKGGAAVASPPRQPGVERRRNHPMRPKNGYYQVILTQAVPHVGQPGDLVKVRAGFARNYLLPMGLATFATPHNVRIVERHKIRLRQLEEARRAELLNIAAQINQTKLYVTELSNADGYLYGSVNADRIASELQALNFPVTADQVRLDGTIKQLGNYKVNLHLGQDVDAIVELWVMPADIDQPA
ncbi:ribosomal protein L9 [Isosphaera pallida ATCC 43644]|uniref:Large ribosomal subunit protein bL9 n=1 Tax=Isosphaera pallida (strain ATCC 43644 / DSM 9630 / IS1B) TaxID=575540 RepID=E8R1M5_ISOPI|nr:50S ribosomal protein L9 [Isosphaera pallida]ADV63443.1 ribosomal protein L9 [Isosphaera pallida ATCC 43644]